MTYEYAHTIIKLMLKHPHPDGKVLLIGGGIANFTDVADTFKGVIQALTEKAEQLKAANTKIYVRRGGPNYQTGLKLIRECGEKLGLDMQVFGPESHITEIVSLALKNKNNQTNNEQSKEIEDVNIESFVEKIDLSQFKWNETWNENNNEKNNEMNNDKNDESKTNENNINLQTKSATNIHRPYVMTPNTTAIVYGMQVQAVQNMLDFDYISRYCFFFFFFFFYVWRIFF